MARPLKQGLDYFPLDVNCDDTVKLIEAKFGTEGFGVLIKLWQIIYENGYYIKWTERELLLYKNRINVDIILINDIINECVKWGLFNEALFKKQILTSSGIQKRYVEAVKRRSEITIEKQLWLTDIPKQTDKFTVNVYNNPINDDINSIDSHISTQSKVKENRIEQNIVVPYQAIFDLFNETCKSIPKIKGLSQSRKEKLKTRWMEMPDIDEWRKMFEIIESTPFLKGENKDKWKCTFDWLVENDRNYLKVLEGNYSKDSSATRQRGFKKEEEGAFQL